jgi:Tfp pilus assembly PilM family ATPase
MSEVGKTAREQGTLASQLARLRSALPGPRPRLLALEWTATEARIVVAQVRGETCVFEQAFSLPLTSAEGDAEQSADTVGDQIAAALAERGLHRVDTLVAVGRTNIELRPLTLPPAPDDELPDMVRMQALRELDALEEHWPLDFIPADRTPDQPARVLAAAIDPALVAQILETCQKAALKPARIVLRPCAAAALLNRAQPGRSAQLRLLVDLLLDEADLTAILDGKVTFLRTVRLPGDPLCDPAAVQSLVGEIRRTMAAAASTLGGRRFESIVLCGAGTPHLELTRLLADALSVPTELFDPFAGCQLSAELRAALPERPGRFAGLLGMLLEEAAHAPQAIDFLHPRRRPTPRSRRQRYILAAVAGLLAFTAFVGWQWWEQTRLEGEIKALAEQSRVLDLRVEKAQKTMQEVAEVGRWMAAEIVWLDELRELCSDFSPAEDAMLTQLAMGNSGAQGGEMKLEGMAQTAASIDTLEQRLRDKDHQVEGKGRSLDNSQRVYSWRFISSLLVKPKPLTDPFERSLIEKPERPSAGKPEKR